MDIAHSVAGDLIRIALRHDVEDQLEHTGALVLSLRGALLVDLVIDGRLTLGPDGSQMDTSPTGWALADEAMHYIDEHPTAPMDQLLQRGEPHLHDFVAELVDKNIWTITRHGLGAAHTRFADAGAEEYRKLYRTLSDVASRRVTAADPRTTALALLAMVSGCTDIRSLNDVPEEFFQSCGSLEAIVRDVAVFVQESCRIDIASGRADLGAFVFAGGA